MSALPTYLDFELSIVDLGGGRYRASVDQMPLGDGQPVVAHEFVFPFGEDDLPRILAILSGRVSAPRNERLREARAFGETLFKTVFDGPVYTVYFSSRDRARTTQGLRIRLSLDRAGALAALPWEFLRDPAVDFLALSRTTPLVRHPRQLVLRSRPAFEPPLRVLVMMSSPSDMPPVDVEGEWRNLLAATETLRARGAVEMERLPDASLRTLQQVLRTGDYHVFHFIGHSAFDPVSGEGTLALEDSLGERATWPVGGEQLARELSEENTIRLVIMNSCQSAVERRDDPFAGIASSLVARGIPAVVAMQFAIGEQAARVFAEELYRALSDEMPVDASVAEARRAVSHAVSDIEWATPVLFMRAADGQLFDVRRASEPVERRARWPLRWVALVGVAIALLVAIVLLLDDDPGGPLVPDVDILINEFDVIPARPILGERAAIIVRISSSGGRQVGPLQYEFREDVLDSVPSVVGEIADLAPGHTETLFIPYQYTWWGAFVSEIRVDVASDVPETDEFNNISRSPVVISDKPLVLDMATLLEGQTIGQSVPVSNELFAQWGLAWSATPPETPGCEDTVAWAIVESEEVFLGTGKPNDPSQCTDGGLVLVTERGVVGGISVMFAIDQPMEHTLIALDEQGREIERAKEMLTPKNDDPLSAQLVVMSTFSRRLEIAQVLIAGDSGSRLRVSGIELYRPSGVASLFR